MLTEAGHGVALLQHVQRTAGGVLDDLCQLVTTDVQRRIWVVQLVQPLNLHNGTPRETSSRERVHCVREGHAADLPTYAYQGQT